MWDFTFAPRALCLELAWTGIGWGNTLTELGTVCCCKRWKVFTNYGEKTEAYINSIIDANGTYYTAPRSEECESFAWDNQQLLVYSAKAYMLRNREREGKEFG
jgi:hypothetical protein